MKRSLLVVAVSLSASCGGVRSGDLSGVTPRIVDQASGTTELLQAVSVVDENVVWISGHGATVVRTTDGGATWSPQPVTGAPDILQFRDIHALNDRTAWVLAAGPGDMSRIYRTNDGGASWALQWTNPEAAGFYDCLDFWDARRGVAYGDAVDGGLRILLTDDGGASWRLVPQASLPAAQAGEGGFAASGLCVQTRPGGRAWIAAGNAGRARVFRTADYGRTWTAADAPVESGEAAGLTSIAMVDDERGYAFGGNLGITDRRTRNVARTRDGGRTWSELPAISFDGAIYGGLHVDRTRDALLAVGPSGFAVSTNGGESWTTYDARAWWGVGSAGAAATWIAGPGGRIARIDWLHGD